MMKRIQPCRSPLARIYGEAVGLVPCSTAAPTQQQRRGSGQHPRHGLRCACSDGRQSVDEDGMEVPAIWKGNAEFKTKHSGTDGACMRMRRPGHPNHGKLRQWCFQSSGPMIQPARAVKVALFHYATKSLEDFTTKMSRGSGMSAATKNMDYFGEISRCGPRGPSVQPRSRSAPGGTPCVQLLGPRQQRRAYAESWTALAVAWLTMT